MHEASKEWKNQRITAIIGLFSTLLILALIALAKSQKHNVCNALLTLVISPFGAVFLIIMVISLMYHGAIGMKIIIEDYVTKPRTRRMFTNLIFLFSYFIIGILSLTIVTVHIKHAIAS